MFGQFILKPALGLTQVFSFSSFFIHLQQREEAIMEDQKRALRRYNERKAVADFQNLQ